MEDRTIDGLITRLIIGFIAFQVFIIAIPLAILYFTGYEYITITKEPMNLSEEVKGE